MCVVLMRVKASCVKVIMTADYPPVLQVRRGQRTVQTETKYIELMVVNDYELVRVMLTALSLFNLCLSLKQKQRLVLR